MTNTLNQITERLESQTSGIDPELMVAVPVVIDDARGVSKMEPSTAFVSPANPHELSSVRSAFCTEVHFFGSTVAAEPWLETHPGGAVIPVFEASQLAVTMAQTLLQGEAASGVRSPHYECGEMLLNEPVNIKG